MNRRLSNRLRLASDFMRRKVFLSGGPIEITLESTAKCNLYCPMCPRHIYQFDNEDMDFALYRKILRDCKEYVEFVWPYGIGEPLIHPNIFEMIRIARVEGIRTGMSTNATLLDDERAELLLDSELDYLILAFDGATKEVYEKYRSGAVFERTRDNIVRFLAKKLQRRSPMHVVLQMVLLRDNVSEMDKYRQLWAIPGVDEIRFKRDEIQIEGSKIRGDAFKSPRRSPCHLLWRGPLYVRYDGLVYPCCYMYGDEPAGDLRKDSLMDVWNSNLMTRLREAHLRGDLSAFPTCQTCQAPRPAKPAFYASLAVSPLLIRKVVPLIEKFARRYNVGVFERS